MEVIALNSGIKRKANERRFVNNLHKLELHQPFNKRNLNA